MKRFAAGLGAWLVLLAVPSGAQDVRASIEPPTRVVDPALDEDGASIAERLGSDPAVAAARLRLQQASVAVSDAMRARYGDRIAGIAVEHVPAFRLVVRLTGEGQVTSERVAGGSELIDVVYVPGAAASHAQLVAAIAAHQTTIRASLLVPPGLGVDQRSGELVAVVSLRDVAREGAGELRDRLASLTGVPVRLRTVDQPDRDLADETDTVVGGMRMMGGVPGDPRRYICTAGFVVTDGTRPALSTAAHCPDTLKIRDAAGRVEELPYAGQWGWGNHDVQINLSARPLPPRFFADRARQSVRTVTAVQPGAATRAGDIVCHRGERTGYSCAPVELTDFAPAGDLCGGACLPTWTTVAGPACGSGDSGGPVFLGTTAHGLVKGGSYRADGSCAFYFYMSIDQLPSPWRVLTASDAAPPLTPPADPVPVG
ncbi:hypothetical protein [Sphingomonas guangdongensis]|nr:hypothetical protein [Sphingomonas guangdongensis]